MFQDLLLLSVLQAADGPLGGLRMINNCCVSTEHGVAWQKVLIYSWRYTAICFRPFIALKRDDRELVREAGRSLWLFRQWGGGRKMMEAPAKQTVSYCLTICRRAVPYCSCCDLDRALCPISPPSPTHICVYCLSDRGTFPCSCFFSCHCALAR